VNNLVKNLFRIIASLLLIILLLGTCFVVINGLLFGLWLRTYQAFTQKTLVAELTVERTVTENSLEKFKVIYTEKAHATALDTFLSGTQQSQQTPVPVEFELYGDQVLVGGPVVKFQNVPVLLGFQTVYKVARLQGSYINTDKANRIPNGNVRDLNGGVDNTWSYFEEQSENMQWLIDTAYFSLAGKSIQSGRVTYGLYITEDGFLLDKIN
jgi:hypothetical protein